MNLQEFFIKIGLVADKAAFDSLKKSAETVASVALKIVDGFKWAGLAVAGFFHVASDNAAEIEQLAALMGVSVERVQKFIFWTQKAGVDTRDLAELSSELSENIGEAAGGTGEAADAFKALGIKTKDAKGNLRATDEVLIEIADKMRVMKEGTAQTSALMGLFGEQGIQLLKALNAGSEGFAAAAKEAEELGLVLDASTVRQGAKAGESILTLKAITKSFATELFADLSPTITQLVDDFKAWWKVNRDIVKQRLSDAIKTVVWFFKLLVSIAWRLAQVLGFLLSYWKLFAWILGVMVAKSVATHIAGIGRLILLYAAMGVSAMSAGLAAAKAWILATWPLVAFLAGVAAIVLLIQDFLVFLEGGDSMIGRMLDKYRAVIDEWMHGIGLDEGFIKVLWLALENIDKIDFTFGHVIDNAKIGFAKLWEAIKQGAIDLVDTITSAFAPLYDMFGDFIPGGSGVVGSFKTDPALVASKVKEALALQMQGAAQPALDLAKPVNDTKIVNNQITISGAQEPERIAKTISKMSESEFQAKARRLKAGF